MFSGSTSPHLTFVTFPPAPPLHPPEATPKHQFRACRTAPIFFTFCTARAFITVLAPIPREALFEPREAFFEPPEAVFEPPEAVFEPPEAVFEPPDAVFDLTSLFSHLIFFPLFPALLGPFWSRFWSPRVSKTLALPLRGSIIFRHLIVFPSNAFLDQENLPKSSPSDPQSTPRSPCELWNALGASMETPTTTPRALQERPWASKRPMGVL